MGNRAVGRLLRSPPPAGRQLARWPTAADVKKMWKEKWETEQLDDEDCADACNQIARWMGVKGGAGKPVFRISKDDDEATATEAAEAYSRGFKYRDRIVKIADDEFMKVHSGKGGKNVPTVRSFPLLPGMLIYTAENAGWKDKEKKTYRWYLRHMQMYGGNGVVYENFRSPTNPRTLLEGDPDEDKAGAYNTGDFLVTLSIYDPFFSMRTPSEQLRINLFRLFL
jgi:hypothetical protein